ncbi:MAG: c-type cytochrome [Gemmataceae bacterium]|nr:c-type cytochrome [Gemmata sp.]MDW8198030.1 c-type cytochrome [Gemmataceae bacterium]
MAQLRTRFDQAATVVRDANATPAARVRAANWLAYGPFETAAALTDQLTPHTPPEVQIAIIQMLSTHTDPSVGERLLKNWSGYGPTIRAEVLAALISRPERVRTLLAAVEAKKVSVHEFTSAQIQQLQNHPNATIRAKAVAVFQRTDTDRAKVVKTYFPALELKGDPAKGQTVFRKTCAACHRLDGFGNDVGANLVATLPNKSGDDLLVAIFDPNREVDPRYVAYTVVTSDERVLQGVIATETPTSLTLRLADGKEEVILRSNVASLRSTGRSLMPEGLEKELSHQDVADLFAYFRSVVR